LEISSSFSWNLPLFYRSSIDVVARHEGDKPLYNDITGCEFWRDALPYIVNFTSSCFLPSSDDTGIGMEPWIRVGELCISLPQV
jgi:hypothetical protein